MDIRQLKYFATIAEKESFTKASELLGIAQPSLGFQIKKLEDELNVQLFVRTTKGVQLTPVGVEFLARGKAILSDVEKLKRDISDSSENPRGIVSLGLTPTLADRFLLTIVTECAEQYPLIQLTVTEEMSQNLIDLLQVGQIGFAAAYNMLMLPVSGVSMEHIANEDVVLLMPPAAAVDVTGEVNYRDLAKYPLILPRKPHRLRYLAERAAEQCGIELNIASEMQSVPTILRLVEHGLGSTLMSRGRTHALVRNGKLVSKELVNPSLHHDISIIQLESKPLSRAEECVASIIRKRITSEYGSPGSR